MSVMSSSLFLEQCPACLVRLIWIVLEIEGKLPYKYCFVGCCFQRLFKIARSILLQFPSSFFSMHFVSYINLGSGRVDTAVWMHYLDAN